MKEDQINRAMGAMRNMMSSHAVLPKVKFFQGEDGIINILKDVLKKDQLLFGMVNASQVNASEKIVSFVKKEYVTKRSRFKNPSWIIFADNVMTRDYQKLDSQLNRNSLVIPEHFNTSCHIYGNKVAFFNQDKDDLSGVIIENNQLQKTQLLLFRHTWESAKKISGNEIYKDVNLPKFMTS